MTVTFEQIKEANSSIVTTAIERKDKNTGKVSRKDYAEVNQRIKAFRMVYPTGQILTEMISNENGVCIFRANVYDEDENLLATGTAYEKESSSFINKTSYIENCVPLSTQILTQNGWKYYYQLRKNDLALSYNFENGKMEFCEIENINIYKDRLLLEMSSSRFKVKCTAQHKWIVKTQYKPLHKLATQDLTNSFKIVQAVKQDVTPSIIGKKLGWLMCDCEINDIGGMASTAYIRQSKYVDEINELFGEGRLCKKYSNDWMDSYEWIISADEVRRILGSFGMANYKDLPKAMAEAKLEDVAGCFESMMLADGEKRGFSTTYIELIEAIQIMCARLGIATTFVTERMMEKSTKPIYTIGIKTTDGAWFSELEVRNLPPQDVWCPTTKNGTWVMKQDGFVTLTSNCETSAVGRALGMAGFGIDVSVASYEEVANAIENQNPKKQEEPKGDDGFTNLLIEVKNAQTRMDDLGIDFRDDKKVRSWVINKSGVETTDIGQMTEPMLREVLKAYKALINAKEKTMKAQN